MRRLDDFEIRLVNFVVAEGAVASDGFILLVMVGLNFTLLDASSILNFCDRAARKRQKYLVHIHQNKIVSINIELYLVCCVDSLILPAEYNIHSAVHSIGLCRNLPSRTIYFSR